MGYRYACRTVHPGSPIEGDVEQGNIQQRHNERDEDIHHISEGFIDELAHQLASAGQYHYSAHGEWQLQAEDDLADDEYLNGWDIECDNDDRRDHGQEPPDPHLDLPTQKALQDYLA